MQGSTDSFLLLLRVAEQEAEYRACANSRAYKSYAFVSEAEQRRVNARTMIN